MVRLKRKQITKQIRKQAASNAPSAAVASIASAKKGEWWDSKRNKKGNKEGNRTTSTASEAPTKGECVDFKGNRKGNTKGNRSSITCSLSCCGQGGALAQNLGASPASPTAQIWMANSSTSSKGHPLSVGTLGSVIWRTPAARWAPIPCLLSQLHGRSRKTGTPLPCLHMQERGGKGAQSLQGEGGTSYPSPCSSSGGREDWDLAASSAGFPPQGQSQDPFSPLRISWFSWKGN